MLLHFDLCGKRTSIALVCMLSACELEVSGQAALDFDSVDSSITERFDAGASLDAAELESVPGHSDARAPTPDTRGSVDCDAPVLWYADEDRDGWGDAARTWHSCEMPADGASRPGDCADHDPRAHPQQDSYFGEPYQREDGTESFDFDCSGKEEGQAGVPLAPASCGLLSLALCDGSGYAITARMGPDVNRVCGSRVQQTCQAALGILVCEAVTTAVSEPYACR